MWRYEIRCDWSVYFHLLLKYIYTQLFSKPFLRTSSWIPVIKGCISIVFYHCKEVKHMKIYMEILVSIRVIVFSKNKSQQSLDDIIESAVKITDDSAFMQNIQQWNFLMRNKLNMKKNNRKKQYVHSYFIWVLKALEFELFA